MTEQLLPYYERELAFLRSFGPLFADAYPGVAGALKPDGELPGDPHSERFVEAFAHLNGRIRQKIDDEFPEAVHALWDVIYPHYLVPVPSMAIVKVRPRTGSSSALDPHILPRGSEIETDPIDGEPCRFRTCYPVTSLPVTVESASISSRAYEAPPSRFSLAARSVVTIRLKPHFKGGGFDAAKSDTLRFFLKGQGHHVYPLYELLLNNTLGIAINGPSGEDPLSELGPECIGPVGFQLDEAMLPYPARSFPGYRLLTEFFAFPEKFLFVDVTGLNAHLSDCQGDSIDLIFYLDALAPELEGNISADTFQLGCTPIINLFRQAAEPIRLTHTEPEYRIVPDSRRPAAMEVYSIDSVVVTSPGKEDGTEFDPFYSCLHASRPPEQHPYWHAVRRPSSDAVRQTDRGTEVFLSISDPDFRATSPANQTINVETTCLNRDLPSRLPFGGGQPHLRFSDSGRSESIECLTAPTPTLRPPLGYGSLWRLISHLSLRHVSFEDPGRSADALRETMRLYDFTGSAANRSMIEGVLDIKTRRVLVDVGHGVSHGRCQGVETTVHFDENRFVGSGVYLLASVFDRFLGLYCSLNSFSQLVATTNKREVPLHRWPPRSGDAVMTDGEFQTSDRMKAGRPT